MTDLKRMLNPGDAASIYDTNAVNWVPKEPRELLLPFLPSEEELGEKSDLENRRELANKVMSEYQKIVDRCRVLEATLEQRCKAVKISLNKSNTSAVKAAMARVFGIIEPGEITFEHYKACIQALADLNNSSVPKPGE